MAIEIIKLKPGEQYEITLPGKSTSGYEWVLKNPDDKIISIVKKFAIDNSRTQPVGRSADEIFHLKAIENGTTTIVIQQKRSWEKKVKSQEKKKYKIIVQG